MFADLRQKSKCIVCPIGVSRLIWKVGASDLKWPEEKWLEEESRITFRELLLRKWIVRDKVPDISIDMEIERVKGEDVANKILLVQIKATERTKHSQNVIRYPIETKYLEYYENSQLPVIIALWVKPEKSFYYLFAQRYIREELSAKKPIWKTQKWVTIEFPLSQKLESVEALDSIATDGYFYVAQQLNTRLDTGLTASWLDGIPKSNDKILKERTLKALLHMQNEEYNAAIAEYKYILRVVCKTPSTERMSILLNLGSAYYSLGQSAEALDNFGAVLELAKEIDEKDALEGKAAALGNIGLVCKDKGDLGNALKHLTEALKIDQEIGYRQGESSDLGNIGLVYKAKGDSASALRYLEAALKILDRHKLVYGRDTILRAINSIKGA